MMVSNANSSGTPPSSQPGVVVSLREVLAGLRRDLYHGAAPVEYAVAGEPWGTLALRPGDVVGLAAAPGIGKTALVSQMTVDALRLHPAAKCLIVNVEMPPSVLLERQLSRLSGIPYADIAGRRNLLGCQHRIDPAIATLDDIGDRLFFLGPPFSIERVVEAVAEAQPTILVLDYLQRIECCDGVADTRNRLNSLMHDARTLATAGICVVLVSAVARTPSKKGGGYNAKDIGMGSFRESSEIEYGCDDAFVMVEEEGRPREDSGHQAGTVVRQLRHVKSRNHRQQSLRLEFDGSVQRFRLLSDEGQVDEAPPVIEQAPPESRRRANPSDGLLPPGVDPWGFEFPDEE